MWLVEQARFNLLRYIGLVNLIPPIFIPLSEYLLEIPEQINKQDLPRSCAADEQVAWLGVEAHGCDLVLGEDGEERCHLILAVPEGYFLNSSPTDTLQPLLERLATRLRDDKHVVKPRTPEYVTDCECQIVLVHFHIRITVRGRVECLDVFVQISDWQSTCVGCTSYA